MTSLNKDGLEAAKAAYERYQDIAMDQQHSSVSAYIEALETALSASRPVHEAGEEVAWDEHAHNVIVGDAAAALEDREKAWLHLSVLCGKQAQEIEASQARIAELVEANEALMKERTSLIETKREQIDNLHLAYRAENKAALAQAEHAVSRADAAEARIAELKAALKLAKDTIRVWHGPNAWDIYDRASPEMKTINAALKQGAEA